MGTKTTIELYEQLIEQLLDDMDANEWHVGGETVELDELSSRDGFLPLFGSIAVSHAIAAGLITSFDDFPLRFEPQEDSLFGLEATVETSSAEPMLPHPAAQLFLIDAVHYAVSLNELDRLEALRSVDLHPALVEMEMSHEHHTPEPAI